MLKRIIIYILLAIIISMSIFYKINILTVKENYVDYFVRGYVRGCEDLSKIKALPIEVRNMKLYYEFAKGALEYIKEEVK